MANILTDKTYLDAAGVKVLVEGLKDVRNYSDETLANALKNIKDAFAKLGIDESGNYTAIEGTILRDIYDNLAILAAKDSELEGLIEALDVRLTDAEAKNADQDARLDAIEIKDTEQDGRLDDHQDRIETLEDKTAGLEAKAFESVVAKYDPASHEIVVHFGSNDVPASDLNDHTCVGHFTIDTDDFVKNGLIENVELVTVEDGDSAEWQSKFVLSDIPADVKDGSSDGKKFIVMTFNTQAEQNPNPGDHTPGEDKSQVWLGVENLFNDYNFSTANSDLDYVVVSVSEAHPSENGGEVNAVEIAAGLGEVAKADFSLVEGKTIKEGDAANHPTEGTILSGVVEGLGTKFYGIKDLTVAVDALDAEATSVRADMTDAQAAITKLTTDLETLRNDFDAKVKEYDTFKEDVIATFEAVDTKADALAAGLKAYINGAVFGKFDVVLGSDDDRKQHLEQIWDEIAG